MRRIHARRCGASKLGIAFAVGCVVVLVAIAMFSVQMLQVDHASGYMRLRDGTFALQLNQAWTIMARDFDDTFPAPASIEKDVSANTTANLYSMSIMQNYFTPEICVGPTEPSGRVEIHDGYDWESYDPAGGVSWDAGFKADLEVLSHASYAHMPLHGRRFREWGGTRSPVAIVSNRGPRGGQDDPSSITYLIHGSKDEWIGNVCYEDGRVAVAESFAPNMTDNLFAFDDGIDGGDSILTFTKSMDEDGPVIQHD